MLDAIRALPDGQRFRIEGHTDNRGKAEKNRVLSEKRARAVVQWLVSHGIELERLQSAGYGPDRPLATNTTDAGRYLNRRVEIQLLN